MIKDQGLQGLTISCPMFFLKDERIDYGTIEKYLDDVCKNNHVSAVYSMAYNTRYRMMSDAELIEVNSFIVNTVKGYKKRVFVGHPYAFSRETFNSYLDKISKVKPNGISMLYPERYFGIDAPILEFLNLPASFDLPVVLHEMKLISGHTGELVDWPEDLLSNVFENVNLVGIKEDSKEDKVAEFVLELCKKRNVECILAGGGKVRALKFIERGLTTWLNGSTMFCPHLIDRAYIGFIKGDQAFQQTYLEKIERPFFEKIVSVNGWHIAHRIALHFFGYGELVERFPHAIIKKSQMEEALNILADIKNVTDSEYFTS